jgi:hypothetical protein
MEFGGVGTLDAGFADAVRIAVEKSNAPNFDMPKEAYFDADVTLETVTPRPHPASTAPKMTSDDHELGWSSALFPARPAKPDSTSTGVQNRDTATEESRSPGPSTATPGTSKALRIDGDALTLEAATAPPPTLLDLLSGHSAGVVAPG